MCGISGIITKNSSLNLYSIIGLMNNAISHRGPDGEGVFVQPEMNFALGHKRLSIIDLSENANQPMTDSSGNQIVFNGEIYNFVEIKNELLKSGVDFKTSSDTEVILASYKKWGLNCFNLFNGMWALCIYDKQKNKLVFSRDRFGVKPFYFYKDSESFIFGSEIKQILSITGKLPMNEEVFRDFLFFDFINHNDKTFYRGIDKLMPGHYGLYSLDNHEFSVEKYFQISLDNSMINMSEKDKSLYYHNLLNDSVKLRLRSDVQVGICLSGGLDSSIIAELAAKNNSEKESLVAITAKSSERKTDETYYASLVAKKFGIKHIIVEPSISDFENSLESIVLNQDEPFGGPSIVMQYFVMKAAKESGCKVMLDGQGGDETLLGYERYFFQVRQNFNFFNKIFDYYQISKNSKLSFANAIQYDIFFNSKLINNIRIQKRLNFLNKSEIDCTSYNNSYFSKLDAFEFQKQEVSSRLLPLLHYEDKNSMLHSVEARLPFLDFRVLQAALTLPINLKLKNGWTKHILRNNPNSDLPDEILWRKHKLGFEAPTNTWMSNRAMIKSEILSNKYLSQIIRELPESISITVLWRLYSFSLWCKSNKVIC